jgi:hypothetical protein
MRNVPLSEALSLAFAAVYFFSFRQAIQATTEWGAFVSKHNRILWNKCIRYSVPLLLVVPLITYIPFSRVVAELRITSSSGVWHLLGGLIRVTAALVLLGLFPRATKHIWILIARRMTRQGTAEGQPGEGWLNPNKVLDRDLPDPWYSWQVVFCLGMLPLLILVYTMIAAGVGLFAPTAVDLRNLFVAVYAGLFVVLHHMAKLRRYCYTSSRPRWLWSKRMFLTVPCTILTPLIFGVLCYSWVLALARESNPYRLALGLSCLLVALPFPLYCTHSLLLVARPRSWASKEESPEMYESNTWTWKACLVLAVVCMTGMLYLSITHWGDLFSSLALRNTP